MAIITDPPTHEVKINLQKTQSVNWNLKIEASSNKVSGNLSYTDNFEGWFARAPDIGSSHPDVPALLLVSLSAQREEGSVIKVDLGYESNNPEAQYPGRKPGKIKRYRIERTGGEEPLLKHPLFGKLLPDEQKTLESFMNSDRDDEAYETARAALDPEPFCLYLLKKLRTGVEAWVYAGMTWVETFMTNDWSDLDLKKVGKIYNAPGPAPTLDSPANWLYMSVTADPTEDGKFWNVERRFEASLETGWDEDLYAQDTSP